eukprot:CAMPEP_0183704222 /NCGR_PEP_ID=MMETSP0737-20130205/1622_1 /TAXON_ID=385413 /ORGANISM="Thalassiosira miniscula, Strain CCMP1093" /LENGTH=490 /DNA_ID=CAMNT_0025931049 /DNA_START=194 /DNA_END=1666 /DNA_ORIENTATION=+
MTKEKAKNVADDSSRNLSIMAAAVEQMSSARSSEHHPSGSPTRRSKLVLPTLTPAMQQDLALVKGAASKGSKPLSIGARPEFADYALQGIVTPHPNDVLCGRGGGSNNHPGNESFRELVNEVKFPYVNCPKREKPLIARRIVEAVRNQTPPGRFLSKDSKTGLWNDIGDGKAREKTSQALREGAPIIRDMIGKPTSPTNVAAVLKEAKKAERAEKEYGVKLPKKSAQETHEADSDAASTIHEASPTLPKSEPTAMKRVLSIGNSPPTMATMPPTKKFRSFGEQEAAMQPPTAWPRIQQHPQPGRNFGMLPFAAARHHGQLMGGGFAAPPPHSHPRGPLDYGNGIPRYPAADTVPVETVRRLLLGQLDPIQLAMQILPPEEAAIVARRHAPGLPHLAMMGRAGPGPTPLPPPSSSATLSTSRPLPLNPMVSDASDSVDSTAPRSTGTSPSDQSSHMVAQGGSDSETSKQPSSGKRALPKKKRKYVEPTDQQ